MDFDERLQRAIQRGNQAARQRRGEEAAQALSEEQFKRLHSQYRLQLSEHVELCLRRLPQHFPGFEYENVVSDRGWGAAVNRDDADFTPGQQRSNVFSRLEMTVRPYSSAHVLELTAHGTIRNKEVYNRTHFQLLIEVHLERFMEMIDLWVLEYAELYAARQ
ncbi:MAG TPA: hypothetical protein VMJ32_15930 [Pirellulales bacterium]|nr:hypothetical protein [Pirellulales bacterium]